MGPQAGRPARVDAHAPGTLRTGGRDARTGARHPGEQRSQLRVLDQRQLARRQQQRRGARLVALSVTIVVAALLAVAGAQAFVAERQLRIDALQQQLTSAVSESQTLQLARAELSSPSRVLAFAEHRLKMVAPSSIDYVQPVVVGPTVAETARNVPVPPPSPEVVRAAARIALPATAGAASPVHVRPARR
ncbi:MAG: hypothetical protein ACYCTE_01495 [Acidimicrobiales bacterium]